MQLSEILESSNLTSDPSKAIYAVKVNGKFSRISMAIVGNINESPTLEYEYFISCQICFQDLISWLSDGRTQEDWATSLIQSKNKFDESMARLSA